MLLLKYFSPSMLVLEAWSPMPALMNAITTVNGVVQFRCGN